MGQMGTTYNVAYQGYCIIPIMLIIRRIICNKFINNVTVFSGT